MTPSLDKDPPLIYRTLICNATQPQRHAAIMSHQGYITLARPWHKHCHEHRHPWPNASVSICQECPAFEMCCLNYFISKCHTMSHNEDTDNVILPLWTWARLLDTGGHLSLLADNNHHYHLLTRNKLNCVSLFMQMGQPFQTWVLWRVTVSPLCPSHHWSHHIGAINNIQDVWCLALAASHAKPETCFELNICNNLMK